MKRVSSNFLTCFKNNTVHSSNYFTSISVLNLIIKYSWPLNNEGLNSCVHLYIDFFSWLKQFKLVLFKVQLVVRNSHMQKAVLSYTQLSNCVSSLQPLTLAWFKGPLYYYFYFKSHFSFKENKRGKRLPFAFPHTLGVSSSRHFFL